MGNSVTNKLSSKIITSSLSVDDVTELVRSGADLTAQVSHPWLTNGDSVPLLRFLVLNGRSDCVLAALEADSMHEQPPLRRDKWRAACTSAMFAAASHIGRHDCILPLIKAGAEPRGIIAAVLLNDGCRYDGMDKFVEQLCVAGGDVNAPTTGEQTPLMLATMRVYDHVVRYLVSAGADVSAVDRIGWTAEDSIRAYFKETDSEDRIAEIREHDRRAAVCLEILTTQSQAEN